MMISTKYHGVLGENFKNLVQFIQCINSSTTIKVVENEDRSFTFKIFIGWRDLKEREAIKKAVTVFCVKHCIIFDIVFYEVGDDYGHGDL